MVFFQDEVARNERHEVTTPTNATTAGLYRYLDDGSVNDVARPSDSGMRSSSYIERPSAARNTVMFDIVAVPEGDAAGISTEGNEATSSLLANKKKYKGRYRMWPGIILLTLVVFVAGGLISYYAIESHNAMMQKTKENLPNYRRIRDGTVPGEDDSGFDEPGNPKVYPDEKCAHLDYITKDNIIYAVLPDGTQKKIQIKGINWSGMETSHGVPYGLWDNQENGTTLYQVVSFLARHRFNSVRLPLSVENIIGNIKPNLGFVNQATNRALNVKNYRSVYKSIIEALAYRKISVLLDIHTLTPRSSGGLWYNDEISEDDLLEAVDILGEDLCNRKYWNIVGLDLKNEPAKGTWGGPRETDWKSAAERIGNRMLKACSKWTAFVEGLAETDSIAIDGKTYFYTEWWGAGLTKAADQSVILDVPDKVVWSPHYYSPAVYPARYFYNGGVNAGAMIKNFVEREDDDLRSVVNVTMHKMFGFLGFKHPGAIILGEFGGLHATDAHPRKTTRRVINYIMEMIVSDKNRYAGGYVWSLNPESGYEYNPVSRYGKFQEGLLDLDWLEANTEYLDSISILDDMPHLDMFPCIKVK